MLGCEWHSDPSFPTKRRNKLTFHGSDSSMNVGELATHSMRLKEEQLRKQEMKLKEIQIQVQKEINEKRQELLARESQVKEIEARLGRLQDAEPDK